MVSEDSTSRVMVLPVRLPIVSVAIISGLADNLRLDEDLHCGRFRLSNEMNDGVFDKSKSRI